MTPAIASPLMLKTAAIQQIQRLTQHDPHLKLRLAVSGGGCSGFQYQFELDATPPQADDICIAKEGATLVVDAVSFPLVAGAELDYQESLSGSQFVLNNPNASSTCGCGVSFTVD